MSDQLESRIQQIGQELLGNMATESPSVFRKDYWQGKILEWSMKDPAFKLQMFRFVDVFPTLKTTEQLARHLQEYFCQPDQDFPAWIQLGLKSVRPNSLIAKQAAKQIEKNVRSMASTFVAGEDAAGALPRLEALRREGMGFTVDLLGEATVSEAEAQDYERRYLEMIRDLTERAEGWEEQATIDRDDRGPIPKVNISVKVSALDPHFDPVDPTGSHERAGERLMRLLLEARRRDAFLNVDMESYGIKSLTLDLFRKLLISDELAGWDDAGIVIQAYLRDSYEDLDSLIQWARRAGKRITVRLVKGAYWDYETIHARQEGWPVPVYQDKASTDANYERCAELLLANHDAVRPAFGSHNARSIAASVALAERHGVAKAGYEIQMLYGMAEPLKRALIERGYRMREYVPVGELIPGMAYLVRRLLENTSNEGFLRAKFVENVDPARLLSPPSPPELGEETEHFPVRTRFRNEPHRDMGVATNRETMAASLRAVRQKLGARWSVVIGGRPRQTQRTIVSVNPANSDEVIGVVGQASVEDVQDAVDAAWRAYPAWSRQTMAERAAVLRRVAEGLRSRRDELAAWIVLEVGKQWREADADVAEAIDFCRYYADLAESDLAPRMLGSYPGEDNRLMYQPMGATAVIAPWNFPLAILTGMTMASVVAGNTVVMKPAEQSPVIAAQLFEVIREAGVPDGVVNFVPGRGEEVGARLVEHPWIRLIAFTGSREVGLGILQKAYTTDPQQLGVKRVVCEMGGKNAIIVDDDADLDEAVASVLSSAYGYQGQKCSACSRVIVLPANYDAFVERLVEAARSLRIGPAEDPTYHVGPVIDRAARDKVQRYLDIGREEGRALYVAELRDVPGRDKGFYVPPAIFGEIEPTHRIAQEEIFGPVLAVMRAEDFDDALRIANGTSYALTGGVISRSPANLERARRDFRVGNLYINRGCTGALVHRQPFGGFKFSGLGQKAGGPDYLHQFVESRSISENTVRRGFAPEVADS